MPLRSSGLLVLDLCYFFALPALLPQGGKTNEQGACLGRHCCRWRVNEIKCKDLVYAVIVNCLYQDGDRIRIKAIDMSGSENIKGKKKKKMSNLYGKCEGS